MNAMSGATFLCNSCGTIFIVGPNTLEYCSRFSCHKCGSYDIIKRPDLREYAMIDNTGAEIKNAKKLEETD